MPDHARPGSLSLLAAFSFAAIACSTTAAAQPIDSLRTAVQSAVAQGAWTRLEAAIDALRAAALEAPDNLVVQYDLGHALHRRASAYLREKRHEEARPLLEEADRALTRAITLGGGGGAMALRAMVTHQRAAVGGTVEAMRLEPRVFRQLDTALTLAPQDPRVALLNGMARLHAPRAFDGGPATAEREFRRALLLFEADTANGFAPRWGRTEAWIWLGIALEEQDRRDEARNAYESALAVAPGHAWVTTTLLPHLDATARVPKPR
jgi:tetratricopeptide (TPR) repeat protein